MLYLEPYGIRAYAAVLVYVYNVVIAFHKAVARGEIIGYYGAAVVQGVMAGAVGNEFCGGYGRVAVILVHIQNGDGSLLGLFAHCRRGQQHRQAQQRHRGDDKLFHVWFSSLGSGVTAEILRYRV